MRIVCIRLRKAAAALFYLYSLGLCAKAFQKLANTVIIFLCMHESFSLLTQTVQTSVVAARKVVLYRVTLFNESCAVNCLHTKEFGCTHSDIQHTLFTFGKITQNRT
jgi:hypothetical protein